LQNEVGGLREVGIEAVRRFLHGFLLNLKNRGGVWHREYLSTTIVLDDQLVQSDDKRMDWFRGVASREGP
jgi:hypothetical protein